MNSMCLIKFLCSSSHQLRSRPRMQCLRLFDVSLVTAPWDFKFSEVCLRVHPSLYGLYIGYKSRILFFDVHPSINRVFSVPPYWCLSDPFLKHRQVMSKVVRRVSQWMILHLKWWWKLPISPGRSGVLSPFYRDFASQSKSQRS
jgi:hypothetical protein